MATMTAIDDEPQLDLDSGSFPRISRDQTIRGTVLAFLAWTLAVYDFILFGTLLPRISESFGWTQETTLLVNTLVSVGVFVVVVIVGLGVDRLGRRRGMMITVGGAAFSSLLTALSTGVGSLVGFRSLSGFGMAEQSVNSTYLNEIYALTESETIRRKRGFVYSFVQTGWPVGALLAAGFVAVVNAVFGEGQWRYAFALATLPALLVFALRRGIRETPQHHFNMHLRALVRDGRRAEAEEIAARFGVSVSDHTPIRQIFDGRYRRNTIVLSIAWITNYFGIVTTSILGTTMLEGVKNVPASTTLLIVVLSNVVGAAGYIFHGWLGDRIGRRNVIIVGWAAAAVMWTAFVLGPTSFGYVLVTYMLSLFFLLGPYAAMLFYQAECYGSDVRATGSSFVNAMGQPGTILASAVLTALVASSVSLGTAALVVGAGGMFVSAVVMLFARPVGVAQH